MSNKTELATLFLELSLYNPEAHDTTSSPPEAQRRWRRAGQSNPRPEAQRQAGPSLYNSEAHDTTSSPPEAQRRQRRAGLSNPRSEAQQPSVELARPLQFGSSLYDEHANLKPSASWPPSLVPSRISKE